MKTSRRQSSSLQPRASCTQRTVFLKRFFMILIFSYCFCKSRQRKARAFHVANLISLFCPLSSGQQVLKTPWGAASDAAASRARKRVKTKGLSILYWSAAWWIHQISASSVWCTLACQSRSQEAVTVAVVFCQLEVEVRMNEFECLMEFLFQPFLERFAFRFCLLTSRILQSCQREGQHEGQHNHQRDCEAT